MKKEKNQLVAQVADVHLIDKFSDRPGVWLSVTGSAYYQLYSQALSDIGLKPSWVTALALIEQFAGITQSELGRKLKINRASAMALATAMNDSDLITRTKLAKLNQTALNLSETGLNKLTQACDIETNISNQILENIDKMEREKFVTLLKELYRLMTK
ncbi:MarR family winged helix-turn-helix transcriptional regulator [Marinomonas sp.]|uniref:MarR family winged helix-turn-helix transcriptional regulator n=1 Tax=Marinomonas sp. TaxID=1904862 RepID=UPI003BAB24C7